MNTIRVCPWREAEDTLLLELVQQFGVKRWKVIGETLRNRVPTFSKSNLQCRERFVNHLAPNIRKGRWSEDERRLLSSLHKLHANQWCLIAKQMPWRTENSIKCYFHWMIRKAMTQVSNTMLRNRSVKDLVKNRSITDILDVYPDTGISINHTREGRFYRRRNDL